VTRNQQILMMMTWMVSFFSLTAETAEDLAASVLDELGGDTADLVPSDVMNALMREYYKRDEAGHVSIEDLPRAADMGFATPVRIEGNSATLGDGTYVSANYLGIVMSSATPPSGVADDYNGVAPDGSLILKSGGTIPPLGGEERKKVWIAIFSDPSAIDQDGIDQLVVDPPAIPETPNFIEQGAIDAYQHVVENALVVSEQINSAESHNH